jgi:hypothetical protein
MHRLPLVLCVIYKSNAKQINEWLLMNYMVVLK